MSRKYNIVDAASVIDEQHLNQRKHYINLYGKLPNAAWIRLIDEHKALAWVESNLSGQILQVVREHSTFGTPYCTELYCATVILKGEVVVGINESFCAVYYADNSKGLADIIIEQMKQFRKREKRKTFEINLIAREEGRFILKPMEINPTRLDLGLYYNDDFAEVDKLIRARLSKKKDKGIVLLHGLPGTGKTTYR